MQLYIYRGKDDERIPEDVTHVIIAHEVTIITERAFWDYDTLVSVIMHDGVTRIEFSAFADCTNLRYIRLSRSLEYIGTCAFDDCQELRGLFLPPTVREIGDHAFASCLRLRILLLPMDISLAYVGSLIVADCNKLLTCPAVQYAEDGMGEVVDHFETNHIVHEWLQDRQRMEVESSPLHVLCYDTSISAERINEHLEEHESDAANEVDEHHQMTALHILTMNPHATEEDILACFHANPIAAFCRDEDGYSPIDNTMLYNVPGLISMIQSLCINWDANQNPDRHPDPDPDPDPGPDPDPDPDPSPVWSSSEGEKGKKRKRG